MRISDWSSDVCSSDLSAAFRRSHGTHVAALAGGYRPGTADDDFPLILVQLAAENVADTSGDRIEPDLGLALQYIVDRADAVAAARGMGSELPLVINFSFGRSEERRVGKEGGRSC